VLGDHFTHNDLICVQNENEQQRKNAINPNEFNNLDQRDFLHNHPKQDDVKEIIEFWDNNGFGYRIRMPNSSCYLG
jgi:hypothetical protein